MVSNHQPYYSKHMVSATNKKEMDMKNPGDGSRNQIDYILISKRFRNVLLSTKTYPGQDCYSDHFPVAAKFKLELEKTQSKPKNIKLNLALLKPNQTLQELYRMAVQNKVEVLAEAEEVTSNG